MDSQDDLYLIFCLEIIIKFFDIKFDEVNKNENKDEFNEDELVYLKITENQKNIISKSIWEKILNLTEHSNFKLNIFSTYIINYIKPEILSEKMVEKINFIKNKNEEYSEIKKFFNDKYNILSIKKSENNNLNFLFSNQQNNNQIHQPSSHYNDSILPPTYTLCNNNNNNYYENFTGNNNLNQNSNNPNLNGLQEQGIINIPFSSKIWYNESELNILKLYIKDKIIGLGKLRNEITNNFKSINYNEEREENDLINKNNFDEITDDIDLIYIANYDNLEEEDNIKNLNNNKTNVQVSYDIERDKEELLDLDELGVIEVDDDIFENFDEENIPVIKNIYKRKKCSAEKYKTNKNSKNVNLLIQNNMNTNNLSNNQKTTDNIYKENNERENLSNQIDYLENEINLESNDLHLKKSKFFFY